MNHLDNNTTPFDDEEELMECPQCLGSKEEYIPAFDGPGGWVAGKVDVCKVCDGTGQVLRIDGYTRELDFLDDEADNMRD